MSALTFHLKTALHSPLNCAALSPNLLLNRSLDEIANIPLDYGRQSLQVKDLFHLSGNDTQNILFPNSCDQLDYLGAHLSSGRITIIGDVGAYLGFQLKNGEIHCQGNTQNFAACNMAGGMLRIDGNTGDFLGGAHTGLRKGMAGGTVIVKGNAGDRVGDQMRRGLILIEGNAGDYCGSRMIAGTLGVLGSVGIFSGFHMKHGTLLLTKTPSLHATLLDCGAQTLPFLHLLFRSFAPYDSAFSQINTQRVQRFVGDAACGGNGEILVLTP